MPATSTTTVDDLPEMPAPQPVLNTGTLHQ